MQPSLLRRPFWSDAVGAAVAEVNEYIRTMAGDQLLLFDSAAVLAGENGAIRPEYSDDLLHLNQERYKALNQALGELLNCGCL